MTEDKTVFLAVDGGGTSSRASLHASTGELQARGEGGPSNPAALGVHESLRALAALARTVIRGYKHSALEIGAGISGARNATLRDALARGLCERLHARRAAVCSDVDALVLANFGDGAGVVAIAGTGSSVASCSIMRSRAAKAALHWIGFPSASNAGRERRLPSSSV